ncbi:MAG: tyrosine-type recombinase/integrase [Dehalococcoidia bacterium]|nr:tyrosine-type recombinase/integrase [Dehalococcoidia bacterium]
MRTREIADRYLEEARYRQLAPKTVVGYGWALKKLSSAFPEELPTQPGAILSFIGSQELAPTSRHDLWRALRTFWRWAAERGIAENVMGEVPAPKLRPTLPRALSEGEVEDVLIAATSWRDKALVAVPLDTGIRLGEIASLRWRNVRDREIVVSGKTGERVVPISPNVRRLLSGLGDGEYVWVGRRGPMTLSGIQLAIRRVLYRAGVNGRKSGPHVLRHTFALHYILNGGDVFSLQRILGHSNLASTMIYVHMSTAALSERHAQFSPLSGLRLADACA